MSNFFNYIFRLLFPEDRTNQQNLINPKIQGALSVLNIPRCSVHINNSNSVTIDLSKLPTNITHLQLPNKKMIN